MIEVNQFDELTQIKLSREDGGRPVYWTSAYLLTPRQPGAGEILIDTGCPITAPKLLDFLEGRDVRLVVNTHHHEDHVGANRLVAERFGAEVLAHPDSIPVIENPPELEQYRDFVWGRPEPA